LEKEFFQDITIHSPRVTFAADSINPTAPVQPQIELEARMATKRKDEFIDDAVDDLTKSSPKMNTETDEAVPSDATTTVPPSGKNHTHTFIFLHGREDFGSDLALISSTAKPRTAVHSRRFTHRFDGSSQPPNSDIQHNETSNLATVPLQKH
jgi:hypothetical protein